MSQNGSVFQQVQGTTFGEPSAYGVWDRTGHRSIQERAKQNQVERREATRDQDKARRAKRRTAREGPRSSGDYGQRNSLLTL